jgi:hypothetical protein
MKKIGNNMLWGLLNSKMKRSLLLLCIVLLSACQPFTTAPSTMVPGSISVSPSTTLTSTSIAISSTFTGTNTPAPVETLTPTETPTPLPPQFFDPATIHTVTPSSPAQCPKENPSLEYKASDFSGSNLNLPEKHEHHIENVLSFLNSGGSTKSSGIKDSFLVQDVTGDTVPELLSSFAIWVDIFGCQDGKYELLFSATDGSALLGSHIVEITDINANGIAEIVVYISGCLGGSCPMLMVYEWDGKVFRDLIADWLCHGEPIAPYDLKIQDIDNNGTKEIIFQNIGQYIPKGIDGFPYRVSTLICMWNGDGIFVYKDSFDAPYYRFQAVQDGDAATLSGDYDKALNFYHQAIFDDKLEWFTQERNLHEYWVYLDNLFPPLLTPTASPSMNPDPNEYPNLAAYSLYRIMLIHILRGNSVDAKITYETLQNQYPFEKPGGYFAKMAFVFWQKYQTSQSIQQACEVAVAYAQENPDTLNYLGDYDHGTQWTHYSAETICPFK